MNKLRPTAYARYINSDRWRNRRTRYLNQHGNHCQACGTRDNVQVHHRSYDNFRNEPDTDLRAVCQRCHSLIHQLERDGWTLAGATDTVIQGRHKPPKAPRGSKTARAKARAQRGKRRRSKRIPLTGPEKRDIAIRKKERKRRQGARKLTAEDREFPTGPVVSDGRNR